MINIENEVEVESMSAGELEPGDTFVGTVGDINGEDVTGVFVRTATGLVMLDDLTVEFDTFDKGDTNYAPTVTSYQNVDVDVTVREAW